MASVLEFQALSTTVGVGGLQAASKVSLLKCGKTSESHLSLAWCGTNLMICPGNGVRLVAGPSRARRTRPSAR